MHVILDDLEGGVGVGLRVGSEGEGGQEVESSSDTGHFQCCALTLTRQDRQDKRQTGDRRSVCCCCCMHS